MDGKIFQRVKRYINMYHMIAPGDTIVAGVSGGADSVCLFLMLCALAEEMDFRLAVVHVNHKIRPEAAADAAYVEALCKDKGIPFILVEEDVRAYAKERRLSEEEAGREVRYQAFEEALGKYGSVAVSGRDAGEEGKGCGRIAVAHNANDRAETMLFHLFRGTGLTGAGGIRPVRGHIIRPLLCLQREEIEEYLGRKGISFCIDQTNSEDTYTRNRIRSHILPFAEKEVCAGAVRHMCGAGDLFQEADAYIRRQAGKAYGNCKIRADAEEIVLDAGKLQMEEPFIRKQIFLQCLEGLAEGRKDVTSVHVESLEGLLGKQGSKRVILPYGLKARKEYGSFIIYKEKEPHKGRENVLLPEIAIEWRDLRRQTKEWNIPGLGRVEFAVFCKEEISFFREKSEIIPQKTYTKWLDYDRITKSLVFRTRKTGDYLTINKEFSKKKLKDYMIEMKIPKDDRENLYVLADGSHIIWVPGYRISEYYKITGETKYILRVQLRGGL